MADTWKGKELTDSNLVVSIHYRIHGIDTGELLGFGTHGGDGSLESAVRHFHEVQAMNPDRRVAIHQYDAPAHYTEQ